MTHFMQSGSNWMISPQSAIDIKDKLPAGTYIVKRDPQTGAYYLGVTEGFKVPDVLYGDTEEMAHRILKTFGDREQQTGVLLDGVPGSGKTLLAKVLSRKGIALGIPTILINEAWYGDDFNAFLQIITQPTIVIFDEFEKVYSKQEEQEAMLTLLDGVYPAKKLYVVTTNDKYRMNTHMMNRPGRLYYRLDFKGLGQEFIQDYCRDNLENKSHIDTIKRISVAFKDFNFDILKAMVEEMNRYGEDPLKVMSLINARPTVEQALFNAVLTMAGKVRQLDRDKVAANPLGQPTTLYYDNGEKDSDGDPEYDTIQFQPNQLVKVEEETGEFIFRNEAGDTLSLKKHVVETFSKWEAF